MADQELRDSNGRLLGRIKILFNGVLELRDRVGNLMGTYDPKSNETRDKAGKFVAKNNILASLL
jgi:hypothetical protein